MPTTKTRAKATTENPNQAAELFEKGQPILAEEKPAATLERKPFLCEAAERITEAVADILLHGSVHINLERLIEATVSQEYRRQRPLAYKTEAAMDDAITSAQEKELPRMLLELADLRTARINLKDDERPEPADIIGRIRETARHQCALELQDFLVEASGEELRLMWMIMQNRGGISRGEVGYGAFPLATAFQEELDYNSEYFRVPRALAKQIDAYLSALLKTHGKQKETE